MIGEKRFIEYKNSFGWRGVLYGRSSMSIYDPSGREIIHTSSRRINTLQELIGLMEGMVFKETSETADMKESLVINITESNEEEHSISFTVRERIHELKILPRWFNELYAGKDFEIRKYDRPFVIGDTLILREWDGEKYTGAYAKRKIKYIYTGDGNYGIEEGYCILGLEN